MNITFSDAYSYSGQKRIDVFVDEKFSRLRVERGEFAQGNNAWAVVYFDRSKRGEEYGFRFGERKVLADDLTVKAAREFAAAELERMIDAGEEYRDFDYTPVFEGEPTITPGELMTKREELIAAYEDNKGKKGFGEEATRNKVAQLWGFEDTRAEFERETFFCQSSRPFARAVVFTLGLAPCGVWVWGLNADLVDPVVRSLFNVSAGSNMNAHSTWDAIPYATREETLTAGVMRSIEAIEELFSKEGASDAYMTAKENAEIVKVWLTSLLPVKGEEGSPAPLTEANGQMLLFPASEGVPDDYEDERRRKIKEAREDAEYKKIRADERKKQASLIAKICDREAHYAQVLDVIDEARVESMKHPKKIMVAVDTSDDPEVLELGEWKAMPAHKREQFALYAIWEGGVERTWDEVKDLVDVMPEPKEDTEADSSEEAQDPDFEEDEISGAEDPIEELAELAEDIDVGEYSDPKDAEKTEEGAA